MKRELRLATRRRLSSLSRKLRSKLKEKESQLRNQLLPHCQHPKLKALKLRVKLQLLKQLLSKQLKSQSARRRNASLVRKRNKARLFTSLRSRPRRLLLFLLRP